MAIFFIKDTPFEFWFRTGKCSQTSKLVQFGPVGRHPHLSKTARIVGPQIHELAHFFIKQTPSEFWFCVIKSWKIFKSANSGPIGRPPIFQNGPQNGASNTWVGIFFHKTDPLWIWILCRKLFKIFQIGRLWADWQTPPICPKRPTIWGPKYKSWHFFHKTVPLSIWILYNIWLKNFQIGPAICGPKQWIGNFFQ